MEKVRECGNNINATKVTNIILHESTNYQAFNRLNSDRIGSLDDAIEALKSDNRTTVCEGKRYILRLKKILKSMGNHTLKKDRKTLNFIAVPDKDYSEENSGAHRRREIGRASCRERVYALV